MSRPMSVRDLLAAALQQTEWWERGGLPPLHDDGWTSGELADAILATPEWSALRAAIVAEERERERLVCALCLFVGDSEDPTPITIINGNLTCEPHNGYFQGGDHVQAIIAWKREHPAQAEP